LEISAHLLEAKAQAQAALHYSKVTKAALQVQGDCLKMVCRAEERFAEEIDASGQFKHGGDKAKLDSPKLADIGIRHDQLHDFRKVRDLGGDKVGEIIDKAVAEGRSPTKSEILSYVIPLFCSIGADVRQFPRRLKLTKNLILSNDL
jgi:hypothetical protein